MQRRDIDLIRERLRGNRLWHVVLAQGWISLASGWSAVTPTEMADYASGSIRLTDFGSIGPTDLRAQAKLLSRINVICPVQSHLKKYSHSLPTQITSISAAVSSHSRGVSRSSRTRDGMRWTRAARVDELC